MRYLPHTQEDIQQMLQVAGAADLDDLFSSIPDDCRRKDEMNLPEPLTEWELNGHMDCMAASMGAPPFYKVFMGAGSYHHYIPEITRQLLLRSEFFTAYTPYQPEVSQGTLQAIFEFQSMICRIFLKKKVSSRVRIWEPSTSASVMITTLWYLSFSIFSAFESSSVPTVTPSAVKIFFISSLSNIL